MNATATEEEGTLFPLPTVRGIGKDARRVMGEFAAMSAERKGLWTQAQAGLLLGLGRARINQFVQEGRLKLHRFYLNSDADSELVGSYVCGDDVIALAESEKLKGGRPSKVRLALASLNTA